MAQPRPWVVTVACVFLAIEAFAVLRGVPGLLGIASKAPITARPVFAMAIAAAATYALVCVALILPLHKGARWAWSGAMGVFFTHPAGHLARGIGLLVLIEAEPAAGRLVFSAAAVRILVPAAISALLLLFTTSMLLAAGLFHARSWFGIGPREGWRTLLRDGWWAVALGLAHSLLPMIAIAQPHYFR